MTRALITGVTGQDGGYLAELLLAEGATVYGLAAEPAWVPDGVRMLCADLRDTGQVEAAVAAARADEIYHLAGVSSVAHSWAQPEVTLDINVLGLLRLLEAERAHVPHARVVHAASSEIFDAGETVLSETTPVRAGNPYGLSKVMGQEAVRFYRDLGIWVSSAILFNHESPRRPDRFVTRKITQGVAAIARGATESLRLGNLEARRDWGHARDVVRALPLIARHDRPDDFVIATGSSRSVGEFVAAAFAHVGITDWRAHVEVDPQLFRPADAAERRGDASKAASELGWHPEIPFEALVAEMVDADLARVDARTPTGRPVG